MSEIDLPSLAETGKSSKDPKILNPMNEIDDALKACTFGRFHYKLLFVAFVGIVPQVMVSGNTAYLLPAAECDLHMSLLQKGMLNGVPYFGMLFSTVIAGFLTDTFGRKIFVIVGFGGIFTFTVIGGCSQTYEVLVVAKVFEGILFATCFGAVVSLTAEFCHDGVRNRVILCQSSFVAVSHIILAGISWAVLIQDWHYTFFDGKLVLNAWNFFLFLLSLWSFSALILYTTLIPESPKYLVTQGKFDEARNILINIYKQNTGKASETYPYINIWKDKSKYSIDESQEINSSLRHQLVVGLHNIKPMFRTPLIGRLALICIMNAIVMATYNVLRLWYPQLSTILEQNSLADVDMCDLLDKYTQDLKTIQVNATISEVCVPTKTGSETYINSIIIGVICILPYFITGILVNKFGLKSLFVISGVVCLGSSLGLQWAKSKASIVTLFSLGIAVSQCMMSLIQAVTVGAFPTISRTLALALMMTAGRIGTLVGNIMFPIMLDMGCAVPFYTLSGLIVCVTVLAFLLPKKK